MEPLPRRCGRPGRLRLHREVAHGATDGGVGKWLWSAGKRTGRKAILVVQMGSTSVRAGGAACTAHMYGVLEACTASRRGCTHRGRAKRCARDGGLGPGQGPAAQQQRREWRWAGKAVGRPAPGRWRAEGRPACERRARAQPGSAWRWWRGAAAAPARWLAARRRRPAELRGLQARTAQVEGCGVGRAGKREGEGGGAHMRVEMPPAWLPAFSAGWQAANAAQHGTAAAAANPLPAGSKAASSCSSVSSCCTRVAGGAGSQHWRGLQLKLGAGCWVQGGSRDSSTGPQVPAAMHASCIRHACPTPPHLLRLRLLRPHAAVAHPAGLCCSAAARWKPCPRRL